MPRPKSGFERTSRMAKLIITGMTYQQALMLAHFYEWHGEQTADEWGKCQDPVVRAPMTDVRAKRWLKADPKTETVTLKVKP